MVRGIENVAVLMEVDLVVGTVDKKGTVLLVGVRLVVLADDVVNMLLDDVLVVKMVEGDIGTVLVVDRF